VNLTDPYAFYGYCHRKSREALDIAVRQQQFPSRFSLLIYGLCDIVTALPCIVKKISEIALYLWNLSHLKDQEGNSLHLDRMPAILSLVALQLSIPIVCTAIRIFAAAAGLVTPKYALYGWKIAEAGEEFFYLNFSLHDLPHSVPQRQVCEEIKPASAVYYLGFDQTRTNLVQEVENQEQFDDEIKAYFSDFLNYLLNSNQMCFSQLLNHDMAVKLPNLAQQKTQNKSVRHKVKVQRSYVLSHDTRQILHNLKVLAIRRDENSSRPLDPANEEKLFCLKLNDKILTELPIENRPRLFVHLHLNLHETSLCDDLNLDSQILDQHLMQIADIFSLRLQFGRAHFSQPCSHLHAPSCL